MVTTDVFATVVMVACNFMVRDTYWQMTQELCQQNSRVTEINKKLEDLENTNRYLRDLNQNLKINLSTANDLKCDFTWESGSEEDLIQNVERYLETPDVNISRIDPTFLNVTSYCENVLESEFYNLSHSLHEVRKDLRECERNLSLSVTSLQNSLESSSSVSTVTDEISTKIRNESNFCEYEVYKIAELTTTVEEQRQTIIKTMTDARENISSVMSELQDLTLSNKNLDFNASLCEIENSLLTEKVNALENKTQVLSRELQNLKEGSRCPFQSKMLHSEPNRCFSIYTKKKLPWKVAGNVCESLGGSLAQEIILTDIFTQDIFHEWSSIFKEPKAQLWIGATDIRKEGLWQWTNGQKVDIPRAKWFKNQKRRVAYKDCLTLFVFNQEVYFIHLECNENLPFLCEFKPNQI